MDTRWAVEEHPGRSRDWSPISVLICSVAQDQSLRDSESQFLPLSNGHDVGCWADLTWPRGGSTEALKTVSTAAAMGEALHILSHLNPSIILPVGVVLVL